MNTNYPPKTQSVRAGAWAPALAGFAVMAACAAFAPAAPAEDNRAPEVPDTIKVPEGAKVHFHGFARGVQIYTWDGAAWGPAVPDATLFDNDGNVVIEHTAGPTWTSNSGSEVVGALPPLAITVDTNSIPWLRLSAIKEKTHGPGILDRTTFIHRVNTVGGKTPSVNGTFVGQTARVPYTADYFFYRNE
jgi:hypothetical protein